MNTTKLSGLGTLRSTAPPFGSSPAMDRTTDDDAHVEDQEELILEQHPFPHYRQSSPPVQEPLSPTTPPLHPLPPSSPIGNSECDYHLTIHKAPKTQSLHFPTLESDGSLLDLRSTPVQHNHYYCTPPAALSTKSRLAKMRQQEQDMASSVDSLADGQYDMVDDASELSSDDHETASLQSFEHGMSEDEAQLTPDDDTGSVGAFEGTDQDDFINFSSKPFGDMGNLAATLTVDEQRRTQEENDLLDSYLTDNLETPRQSTWEAAKQADPTSHAPSEFQTTPSKSRDKLTTKHKLASLFVAAFLPVLMSYVMVFFKTSGPIDPTATLTVRCVSLASAIVQWTSHSSNNGIVPTLDLTTSILEPRNISDPATAQYWPTETNDTTYMFLSLLERCDGNFAKFDSFEVYRGDDEKMPYSVAALIDGVVGFSIPREEAHGRVTYKTVSRGKAKCPTQPYALVVEYGGPPLDRHMISTACNGLTETFVKDIAIAREAAKGITDMISLQISNRAAASTNITTQVAVYLAREVQIYANTAASVFSKAARAGGRSATTVSKDLTIARKDLAKRTEDFKKAVTTTAHGLRDWMPTKRSTKKAVREPLVAARERALALRKQLREKKKEVAAIASPSTSLSKRVRNLFTKPERHTPPSKAATTPAKRVYHDDVQKRGHAVTDTASEQAKVSALASCKGKGKKCRTGWR